MVPTPFDILVKSMVTTVYSPFFSFSLIAAESSSERALASRDRQSWHLSCFVVVFFFFFYTCSVQSNG